MTSDWNVRVERYLDQLAEVNETIDLILDETRVGTRRVAPEEVDRSRQELTTAIGRLESMLPLREELLRADDAPEHGQTLREKLLSTRHIDDARIAMRCETVSKRLDTTRERAVALFVCQYHLANLGQDLIELLSGAATPKTYEGQLGKPQPRRPDSGGGLFNEAA